MPERNDVKRSACPVSGNQVKYASALSRMSSGKKNFRINGIKKWQRPAGRCPQRLKEESVATKCIRTPCVTDPKTTSSCEPEPFSARPDHLPGCGLRRAHRPGAGGRGVGRVREHPAADAFHIYVEGQNRGRHRTAAGHQIGDSALPGPARPAAQLAPVRTSRDHRSPNHRRTARIPRLAQPPEMIQMKKLLALLLCAFALSPVQAINDPPA